MFATKVPKSPSSPSSDATTEKQALINGITEDSNKWLLEIRHGRSKGKTLDSPEVSKALKNLNDGIACIMVVGLKLSEKFQLGNKLCAQVCCEGNLLDDMISFCHKNRKKLPNISQAELNVWGFFMNGTIFSPDISKKLSAAKDLLIYAKDVLDVLYDSYTTSKLNNFQKSAVDYISATTHNMCTFCDVTTTSVRAAGFLPIYLKYLESDVVKNDFTVSVPFLAAASDIMNENDASMAGSRADVEFMMCGIEESIQCKSGQFNGWFAFELAKIIGNLAIFDSNKKILVEYGVLRPLNKLAKQTEEIEQLTATKTLAHLAFDDDNKKTFISDEKTDIVTTLFNLAKSSSIPSVRESARGVLWTLSEQLHSSKKYAEIAGEFFQKKSKGHVMISYSREQRPLLLRVKDEITKAGFTVWMDIEQMRDNVYDRMAEAIQNASVVLISMSYSYQRSEYCRREAAYASSLKKARIPLLVDPEYVAEGWLALMTAGDYHYDFVKKPFEMKTEELIRELERKCFKDQGDTKDGSNKQDIPPQQTPVASSHGQPSYSLPRPSSHGQPTYSIPPIKERDPVQNKKSGKRWKKFAKLDKEQVITWLEKHHLPREVFESYRAKDIVFLAQMKEEAPEVFYKHVMKISKTKNKIEALQLAADFTRALEHLKIPDDGK
ncbi:uncharacterized protein LOC133201641 [Saccostrea echinata]|uniref:uncharacterized protein LOC133201641 n=1 Tax=Saccostrea echinata TaxID=191078 RepID=UPI002A823D2C|nr:uncharacterized protein LOC133201641 [Saccostrea echinata]